MAADNSNNNQYRPDLRINQLPYTDVLVPPDFNWWGIGYNPDNDTTYKIQFQHLAAVLAATKVRTLTWADFEYEASEDQLEYGRVTFVYNRPNATGPAAGGFVMVKEIGQSKYEPIAYLLYPDNQNGPGPVVPGIYTVGPDTFKPLTGSEAEEITHAVALTRAGAGGLVEGTRYWLKDRPYGGGSPGARVLVQAASPFRFEGLAHIQYLPDTVLVPGRYTLVGDVFDVLDLHLRNTDEGTTFPTFTVCMDSTRQEQGTQRTLVLYGTNQGGAVVAFGPKWQDEANANPRKFEVCWNYTGAPGDQWEEVGHKQNTDVGTTSPTFTVALDSENQDQEEQRTLVVFGTSEGGRLIAFGPKWQGADNSQTNDLEVCWNWAAVGPNLWEPVAAFVTTLTHYQAAAARDRFAWAWLAFNASQFAPGDTLTLCGLTFTARAWGTENQTIGEFTANAGAHGVPVGINPNVAAAQSLEGAAYYLSTGSPPSPAKINFNENYSFGVMAEVGSTERVRFFIHAKVAGPGHPITISTSEPEGEYGLGGNLQSQASATQFRDGYTYRINDQYSAVVFTYLAPLRFANVVQIMLLGNRTTPAAIEWATGQGQPFSVTELPALHEQNTDTGTNAATWTRRLPGGFDISGGQDLAYVSAYGLPNGGRVAFRVVTGEWDDNDGSVQPLAEPRVERCSNYTGAPGDVWKPWPGGGVQRDVYAGDWYAAYVAPYARVYLDLAQFQFQPGEGFLLGQDEFVAVADNPVPYLGQFQANTRSGENTTEPDSDHAAARSLLRALRYSSYAAHYSFHYGEGGEIYAHPVVQVVANERGTEWDIEVGEANGGTPAAFAEALALGGNGIIFYAAEALADYPPLNAGDVVRIYFDVDGNNDNAGGPIWVPVLAPPLKFGTATRLQVAPEYGVPYPIGTYPNDSHHELGDYPVPGRWSWNEGVFSAYPAAPAGGGGAALVLPTLEVFKAGTNGAGDQILRVRVGDDCAVGALPWWANLNPRVWLFYYTSRKKKRTFSDGNGGTATARVRRNGMVHPPDQDGPGSGGAFFTYQGEPYSGKPRRTEWNGADLVGGFVDVDFPNIENWFRVLTDGTHTARARKGKRVQFVLRLVIDAPAGVTLGGKYAKAGIMVGPPSVLFSLFERIQGGITSTYHVGKSPMS